MTAPLAFDDMLEVEREFVRRPLRVREDCLGIVGNGVSRLGEHERITAHGALNRIHRYHFHPTSTERIVAKPMPAKSAVPRRLVVSEVASCVTARHA